MLGTPFTRRRREVNADGGKLTRVSDASSTLPPPASMIFFTAAASGEALPPSWAKR